MTEREMTKERALFILHQRCKNNTEAKEALEFLEKSVTQKYGEWKVTPMSKIAYCSICDELIKDVPASVVTQFEFCPKCGHRMVGPQGSENKTESEDASIEFYDLEGYVGSSKK